VITAGQTSTTVGEEKHYNPRLTKPLDEFIKIMENLNLPYPKMIGKFKVGKLLHVVHFYVEMKKMYVLHFGCCLPCGQHVVVKCVSVTETQT
jgi:hypothetical protein